MSPPTSPLPRHSWEPRFVVEHYRDSALRAAVALWPMMEDWGDPTLPVRQVARHPDHLLVANPRHRRPWGDHPWEELPAPLPLSELARWIRAWLGTARYPPQPNFDGDEGAGFCIFWVEFTNQELPPSAYGALVVLPRWIEIHK